MTAKAKQAETGATPEEGTTEAPEASTMDTSLAKEVIAKSFEFFKLYEEARAHFLQRELNKLDPEVLKTDDIYAEHGPGEITFYYKEDREDAERVRIITFNMFPVHARRVRMPEDATDEEKYDYIMLGNYA